MFRRLAIAAAIALAVTVRVARGHAQGPVLTRHIPDHLTGVSLGWNQTWTLDLEYAHVLRGVLFEHDAQLFGLVGLPVAQLGRFAAGRIEAGLRSLVPVAGGFAVAGSLAAGATLADDPTGAKLGFTARASLAPGYFTHTWAFALDLGWEGAYATYMHQSERVHDLFRGRYVDRAQAGTSDARDGVYAFTASRFRIGLAGGYVIAQTVGISLEAGFEYVPQVEGVIANAAIGGMPFYVSLLGDYRW